MTTDENDEEQGPPDEGTPDQGGSARPEHPQSHPTEAVQALEDEQGAGDPVDGERVAGDDVTENPESDDMAGLPGPPPGDAGEPSG